MKRLAAAVSLSACLLWAPAHAAEDVPSAYRTGIQPGCAVGRFSPTTPPQFDLAGYADLETHRPIGVRTQFRIASASKQFTALAVMLLVEEGRIGLDDPARRWLPEMAGAVGDATVRQLLHHTAGVRDHTTLMALVGVEQLGALDRPRTLALMARQRETNFPPGSRIQYSNGNYLLLSEIVARASGMPFERYLEAAIFRPLGMVDSFALPATQRGLPAHGYRPARDGYAVADDVPATSGSGGVVTTIADLARFDRDFRRERTVWRPAIKARMLEPARLSDGSLAILPEFGTPYGAGLGLEQRDGELWISHDGGSEGFAAEYIRLDTSGRSVAVLCNRADARPTRLAESLLTPPPPPVAAPAPPLAKPAAAPEPFGDLDAIAGRYRSEDLDAIYEFRPTPDGFEVTVTSPWTPAPVIDGWGGVKRYGPAEFGTGPIRVVYAQQNGRTERLTLRFGRRVEGLVLVRLPD
ncbi:MAG: beta-lactamase family protein [Caulobacter sp.]|nr:beta-lactamase family protein [Caulobacter sp.]